MSEQRDGGVPAPGTASQGTPRPEGEQGQPSRPRSGITLADVLTLARLPLALAFILLPQPIERLIVLAVAATTDLLDGAIARRIGSSRFGGFIDPVADKLFMLAAFVVVATSGALTWYEVAGVLLRDLVATIAFLATWTSGRPMAIPARLGGKAVTVAQLLTIVAFLTDSSLLRPLAWATAAIALYAIWDYNAAAPAPNEGLGNSSGYSFLVPRSMAESPRDYFAPVVPENFKRGTRNAERGNVFQPSQCNDQLGRRNDLRRRRPRRAPDPHRRRFGQRSQSSSHSAAGGRELQRCRRGLDPGEVPGRADRLPD